MIEADYHKFGQSLWRKITDKPFGSLTKRELELLILQSALDSKLIKDNPADIAIKCRLTLTKTHGYLTDLALRTEPLEEKEAIERLSQLLNRAEVISGDSMLQIAVHDTQLILWIERNLAEGGLLQGESIRRDIIKISPRALASLFTIYTKLPSPQEALDQLKSYSGESWYEEFQDSVKQGKSLSQIVGEAASIAKKLLPLLP